MFNGRNYYHKAANTSKCIFILLYIDINIYICIYNGRIKERQKFNVLLSERFSRKRYLKPQNTESKNV